MRGVQRFTVQITPTSPSPEHDGKNFLVTFDAEEIGEAMDTIREYFPKFVMTTIDGPVRGVEWKERAGLAEPGNDAGSIRLRGEGKAQAKCTIKIEIIGGETFERVLFPLTTYGYSGIDEQGKVTYKLEGLKFRG